MKLTHWRCSRCREFKKLGEEIARSDLGALCYECQRVISGRYGCTVVPVAKALVPAKKPVRKTPGNHNRDKQVE